MSADTGSLWDDHVHLTWRGHLRWMIPLVLAPALYVGAIVGITEIQVEKQGDLLPAVGVLALITIAVVGPLLCLILALVGLHGIWRSWRRSRGRYTRADRRRIERLRAMEADLAEDQRVLRAAAELGRGLLTGVLPPALPVTDVLPVHGESFLFRGLARYQRYYGQEVTYSTSSPMAFGRPSFVAAVLATSAVSTASARSRAQSIARAQWREDQQVDMLISDQRIWCRTAGRGWLRFDFDGITAVYPDLASRKLVMEFEQGEPLLLAGRLVPAACVLALHRRLGPEGLRRHPATEQLSQLVHP